VGEVWECAGELWENCGRVVGDLEILVTCESCGRVVNVGNLWESCGRVVGVLESCRRM